MNGDRFNRRRFLFRSAQVAAAGTALGFGAATVRSSTPRPWSEQAFAPVGRSRVTVLRADHYDVDLSAMLFEAIRDSGLEVRGATVLLKPNLVEYDPDTAINTDPRLVVAAAAALRRLGAAAITVGEGPGHRRDTEHVVRASGLWDALQASGLSFVDLNTAAVQPVALDTAYTRLGTLWLPSPLIDADIVVSMPKLKTHHWAGATLSLKNCFGCVPGRIYGWPKNVLHWQGLEGSILDVSAAIRPALAIIDGIVGMEGDGPIRGTAVNSGVVVVSTDLVAADSVAARLMGFDPERVTHIAEAGRFLGQHRLELIDHIGEDVERSARAFSVLDAFEHLKVESAQRGTATSQAGSA